MKFSGRCGQGMIPSACVILLSVIALTGPIGGCTSREQVIAAKPILRINKREVSAKEFAESLALRLKNYDALYVKDEVNLKRSKEQVIQAFVLETIAHDFAVQEKIVISAKELEAEATRLRGKYPDDNSFRRSLAQENLSFEKWRQSLEFPMLEKKIFAQITEKLAEPPETELKSFFETNASKFNKPARVRLRQIVLAKDDDAQRIHEQLNKGGNMGRLAKEFSIAPEADQNGDTGWIEKGTLDVFDQAFKMNVGSRSKIIKSPYGYHIFEVLAKEAEGRLSFTDAKARIRTQLMERRQQTAFVSWLEQRTREASVFRDDALIESIKITTRGN